MKRNTKSLTRQGVGTETQSLRTIGGTVQCEELGFRIRRMAMMSSWFKSGGIEAKFLEIFLV